MNSYSIFDARLVADPETIKAKGGVSFTVARLADNPAGKRDDAKPGRFVRAKAFGILGEQLARLSKGDVITASGRLELNTFTGKDGTAKSSDEMVLEQFKVHKSETFFGKKDAPADDDPFAP